MLFDVCGLHKGVVGIGKTTTWWLRGRKSTGSAKRYLEIDVVCKSNGAGTTMRKIIYRGQGSSAGNFFDAAFRQLLKFQQDFKFHE